ncbi:MAG: alpha/beta fold hydrolase [Clostridia bacterium]|nr:alpha/beta fold hydrolase [Clostridia bacterium]
MSEILFEQLQYPAADGKSTAHAYIWAPRDTEPRMILQLSHGMCEYVERYDAWARRFAEQGIIFCGNDHIGHGRTAPDADSLGYTAPRGGADMLVEDLHTLTGLMRARYPNLPIVLYGHSMGSFAARIYLTRYGDELAGALISGTAGPGQPTGIARSLAHTIARIRGDRHRSKLLTALAFGAYNKRFAEENDPASWLTHTEQVRAAYTSDAWSSFIFTAAGYETLFSLLGAVSSKKWAKAVPKSLPILLFAGDEDPVGNYGRGVHAVWRRLIDAGCNAELKLYEGGRHEMHNEPNADEVFADLLSFLARIPMPITE